mmetsp:Transcript_27729/g.31168  ORF Transcript_27729/g.31168 Transcript_27729/m.31168 type:complete len:701 (-) Transcript_27729:361-2463(-)
MVSINIHKNKNENHHNKIGVSFEGLSYSVKLNNTNNKKTIPKAEKQKLNRAASIRLWDGKELDEDTPNPNPTTLGNHNNNNHDRDNHEASNANANHHSTQLTILKELSGAFAPGKLTALMGPSGSGKSTLLDTLAGRKTSGTISGTIFFNGKRPTRDDYQYTVGYVEQFDTLVGELTVEDMLRYTADLKLPTNLTAEEREGRVNEVIQMLNLDSCRSTVIGSPLSRGISGGQCKRVNIGLALITRPPVLFLDEPTSGLDSRVANEVIELLHQLAKEQGRTIVCTIHSPTGHAFSCFDDLYMIHNGETIYEGPVNRAQTYFENLPGMHTTRDPEASLPEWLVDLTSDLDSISRDQQQQQQHTNNIDGDGTTATTTRRRSSFAELYKSSDMKLMASSIRMSTTEEALKEGPTVHPKKLHQYPSQVSKLMTLLKFRMVAHYKDVDFVATRFCEKIIYGLLILTLYFRLGAKTDTESINSVTSVLFLIVALCGFGASAFVPALNIERKLFYRELADGCYTPMTYYCSKFIEEAIIAIFSSFVFSVLVFYGVQLTGNFGIFFVVQYLTTLIGVILAYAVSAAVPSLDAACAILPLYVTFCLFFGGFFIVTSKIPPGWMWFSWTSFMRYAWGAFMVNNYRDTDIGDMPVFYDGTGSDPQTVLQFYGMETGPIMNSIGACLALLSMLLIIFAGMGIFALVYIRHEKR